MALLYQGGYLTIDRRIDDETVLLKIPNHEVCKSLEKGYMSRLIGKDFAIDALMRTARRSATQIAAEGYTDSFRTMLQSAYSLLPHDWVCKDEKEAKRYFIAYMCFARASSARAVRSTTSASTTIPRPARSTTSRPRRRRGRRNIAICLRFYAGSTP